MVEKGKAVIVAVVAQDAANGEVLEFVASNVGKMYSETLESVETKWHKGGAIKAAGLGSIYEKIDNRSAPSAAIDMMVHPVTAILALQAYNKDQNKAHLQQVVTELKKLIEKMGNL